MGLHTAIHVHLHELIHVTGCILQYSVQDGKITSNFHKTQMTIHDHRASTNTLADTDTQVIYWCLTQCLLLCYVEEGRLVYDW